MEPAFEERYYIPVKDKRPKGARWKAILDDGHEEYYIQVGLEDEPEWLPLGRFYETVFLDMNIPGFIDDCFAIYTMQISKKSLIKKIKENLA